MRRALVAFATVALLFLPQPISGASFCDRHPGHWKCSPAPTPTPTPTSIPSPPASGIIFGLGSQAETARNSPVVAAARIHILSSWYNGPNDLGWMTDSYHRSIYVDAYAKGFALHLITWTQLPEASFSTPHGIACGRAYPLSSRWPDDMAALAAQFRGGAFYMTLLTEFQTYPCIDNSWVNGQAYYETMKDQYRLAYTKIKATNPQAQVSIGWGGWQMNTDHSLDHRFDDIPQDFQSFQAMHGVSNVADIRAMTDFLAAPVMLAHHMPDGDANDPATRNATFKADWQTLATDASIADLVADGLFAWSIVNDVGWSDDPETFNLVVSAIRTYGR